MLTRFLAANKILAHWTLLLLGLVLSLTGCRADDRSHEDAVAAKLSELQVSYERGTVDNALRVLDEAAAFIDQQKPNPRINAHLVFARVVERARKAIIYERFKKDEKSAAEAKAATIAAIKRAVAEKLFPLEATPNATDGELFQMVVKYVDVLDAEPFRRWSSQSP